MGVPQKWAQEHLKGVGAAWHKNANVGHAIDLWLLNLLSGVVYMLTMPFVALTTAYAYLDVRVADELRPETAHGPAPAEIELSPG